eukprot:3533368-Pleurochrysis_carterae.AAC.1
MSALSRQILALSLQGSEPTVADARILAEREVRAHGSAQRGQVHAPPRGQRVALLQKASGARRSYTKSRCCQQEGSSN